MRVYKHESSTSSRIVLALLKEGGPRSPLAGHAVLYVMSVWREGKETNVRIGNVQDVWVRPDLRGQGYGRTLMDAVHLHARRLGLHSITLTSNEARTEARTLYESMGYARVSDGFRLTLEESR